MFGGEGGFLLRAGRVAAAAGETMVGDPGQMVAFQEGVTFSPRRAAPQSHHPVSEERRGLRVRLPRARRGDGADPHPDALVQRLTTVLPFSSRS